MFAERDTASMGNVMLKYLVHVAILLVLASGAFASPPQHTRPSSADALMGSALHQQDVEVNFNAAIVLYRKVVEQPSAGRTLVAMALVRIGQCYERLGNSEARKAYDHVVREYADQNQVVEHARKRLAALGNGSSMSDRAVVQRLVWTGDNYWSGLPSPDGRYLPWADQPRLMVRDLMTGTDRALDTSPGSVAQATAFSPDGRQIVYAWYEEDTWNYLLKVIDLSNPRATGRVFHKTDYYVRDFESHLYDPVPGAVSPDGRMLAASAGFDSSWVIALIDIVSGQHRI